MEEGELTHRLFTDTPLFFVQAAISAGGYGEPTLVVLSTIPATRRAPDKRANPMTITKVAMLDPKRTYAELSEELEEAARRVLASGRYILGPEVEAFEAACAAYLGVEHAIGVSSGTDALLIALSAIGVGPGDEVILPTYTFFATASVVMRLGAKPVLVDSCPRCFNVDPAAVAAAVTPKTKALLPVHLFGQAAAMSELLAIAKEHGLPVIEDACQAIGAEYAGARVGTIGDLGCFSFFPSKNLGGFGDAGLLVTRDDALAATCRALRVHGDFGRYDHRLLGGNFRIDPLQCALLAVKLARLEQYTKRREAHAALYAQKLGSAGIAAPRASGSCASCRGESVESTTPIELPAAVRGRHVYNQYVIRVPGRRDALQAHLCERGIETAVYYPVPIHDQAAMASLGYARDAFPVAEECARKSLALPICAELLDEEISAVADGISSFPW